MLTSIRNGKFKMKVLKMFITAVCVVLFLVKDAMFKCCDYVKILKTLKLQRLL